MPVLVYIPPIKKNVLYIVKNKIAMEELVENLSSGLFEYQENFPKMIVFCRCFEECSEFYSMFKHHLGDNFTHPVGAPSILSKYQIVDMYTSCTKRKSKRTLLNHSVYPLVISELSLLQLLLVWV